MKILGISGFNRYAAAALAVDGAIRAAACEESFARVPEIGYRFTGGWPLASIEACLARADVDLDEVDRIVVVDDRGAEGGAVPALSHFANRAPLQRIAHTLRQRETEVIAPAAADAGQIGAVAADDCLVAVVVSAHAGASGVFRLDRAGTTQLQGSFGLDRLGCATARVLDALDVHDAPGRGLAALEQIGAGEFSDEPLFDEALLWSAAHGVVCDDAAMARALEPVQAARESAGDAWAVNVRLQRDRQRVAAAFCARVARVVGDTAEAIRTKTGSARIGFAGALLGTSGMAAALMQRFDGCAVVAPVADPFGRALGAAAAERNGSPLTTLALGPEFTESEIKAALENCRLDYLYEPDWPRLVARVSRLLARGSVVAWFQGPMSFGSQAFGTRSILCDPSNRYARENVNRFLRQADADEPLPVTMTREAAEECASWAPRSALAAAQAPIRDEWRDRLRAALTRAETVPLRIAAREQSPLLIDLLVEHRTRTKVPALVSVPLAGIGEPAACGPRDAIRTFFSSAVDALVIGRFLLMKDYWLLRAEGNA